MGGATLKKVERGKPDAKAEGPASADEVDSHTVFVRSLPFSLTDSQLEDIFGEVGPVRHCFTVKEKGSDQHRGFGFVQFAVVEDALRAVQEKNGALLQGRKIKVEIAKRRAPLDQRRPPKADPLKADAGPDEEESLNPDSSKSKLKKRKTTESQITAGVEVAGGEHGEHKKKRSDAKLLSGAKIISGKEIEEHQDTAKQGKDSEKRKLEEPQGSTKQVKAVKKGKLDESGGKSKKPEKPCFSEEQVKTGTNSGETEGYFKEKKIKQSEASRRPSKDQQEAILEEPQGSVKQRPARTVVVGCLTNAEMLEEVITEAKKIGSFESVQRSFSEQELNSRGLAKDGCKPRAAAIVFLSVKAAKQAVATLHQKSIGGGVVWARQLGGEGSKLKKLRLIVRNLPFQVSETALRDLFSPGFCWEVTIPRKSDGLSRGFAFVGFISKAEAEKAIKAVNGKTIGKRPVAVDWAVGKKEYETAVLSTTAPGPVEVDEDDGDSTASESSDEEVDEESEDEALLPVKEEIVKKNATPIEKASKRKNRLLEKPTSEAGTGKQGIDVEKRYQPVEEMEHAQLEGMDRTEEIEMVKKILNKVVTAGHNLVHASESDQTPATSQKRLKSDNSKPQGSMTVESSGKKPSAADNEVGASENGEEDDKLKANGKKSSSAKDTTAGIVEAGKEDNKMKRTVFIRNLPPDAKVPELRRLFSEFGEVKSFRLVLHPITKRPKGTAFLEFAEQSGAKAAIAAAATNGEDLTGLMLKGRAVSVNLALDRDSAKDLAKEGSKKQVQEDRRHLSLAKEGYIQEGTPAAEGVSKKDLQKRKELEHEKATKLRSPNFHVSQTRLSVHNIPKTMSEKEIKDLFLEAVKSRASKQHPVIKQVKILRDEKTGKARGTAFVEFTEHQHALVSLRVLNNNPEIFGREHRPIVEFAIENSLILRKRAAILEKSKKLQRANPPSLKRDRAADVDGNEKGDRKSKKRRTSRRTSVVDGKEKGDSKSRNPRRNGDVDAKEKGDTKSRTPRRSVVVDGKARGDAKSRTPRRSVVVDGKARGDAKSRTPRRSVVVDGKARGDAKSRTPRRSVVVDGKARGDAKSRTPRRSVDVDGKHSGDAKSRKPRLSVDVDRKVKGDGTSRKAPRAVDVDGKVRGDGKSMKLRKTRRRLGDRSKVQF